jgi:putative glutamine amidotransferase
MAPIIGITTYRNLEEGGHYLPGGYAESVLKAGGIPILLTSGETDINRILETVDGLIFAGGGDIDPAVYGGPAHPSVERVDPVRDRFELELAEKAFDSNTPVLGICRGFQLLALASSGELITHIPDEIGEEVIHRAANGDSIKHLVKVEKKSRLAIITGSTKIEVESKHHQAIREISEDWRVMAKADDGIIEAIEHKRHSWMISVLWHPEMSLEDPNHQNIFRVFVEAAGSYK